KSVGPVPCASALPGLKVPDYRVLATDKVLFVGHPVAAVVATSSYEARDAVDLVTVDYEELPAVTDVEKAAKGGDLVHKDFGDNIAYKLTAGGGGIGEGRETSERETAQ